MDDVGQMFVLEVFLLTMIVCAAALAYPAPAAPSGETANDPQLAIRLADALAVLSMPSHDGTSPLDSLVAERLQCQDACPAANRITPLLPPGSAVVLTWSNGVEPRAITEEARHDGASVSATRLHSPEWRHVFAVTELSCHGAGMDVGVLAIPLRNGNAPFLKGVNATALSSHALARNESGLLWRGVVPASGLAPDGVIRIEASSRGTPYSGTLTRDACALGGAGPAIQAALPAATFVHVGSGASIGTPVGETARFSYDLQPLLDAWPGLRIDGATLEIHAPMPPVADGAALVHAQALGAAPSGSASHPVPTASLYGHHPALLRVHLAAATDDGGAMVPFEARLLATLPVALAGGGVPPDPVYRLDAIAWRQG